MALVQHALIMETLAAKPGGGRLFKVAGMPLTPNDFDPLAVVVDWLDACRSGNLNALLDLYDMSAVLECACEKTNVIGHASLAAYWDPKTPITGLHRIYPGQSRGEERRRFG